MFRQKATEISISSINYSVRIYSEWQNDSVHLMKDIALEIIEKLKKIEEEEHVLR
jgi:hypothetical protein